MDVANNASNIATGLVQNATGKRLLATNYFLGIKRAYCRLYRNYSELAELFN
jgi:hypothetical protein